jgi:integrase
MSVQRRDRDGLRRYVVRWYEDGVERSRSFERRADALAFDEAKRRAKRLGAFAPGEPSRERFGEWLETWWRREAPTWAASTRMERGYRIDKWIEPYLGTVRLADLGPGRVRDWRAQVLADGASPGTANAARSILSSILGAAVSDGRLPSNPILGIRDLPVAVSRPHALTPLEIERIRVALSSDRDVVMVGLMAYAGLRPSEVTALTWGSVGGRVTVDRAYTHGQLKGTKTHQRRSVAIPAPLADDLARYREQVEGDPAHLVAPALGRPDRRLRNPDLATAFLNAGNWRGRTWVAACAEAGVRAAPYDLRHSYASLLFHEGQGIREVMLAMGHDSPTTTERHYLHIYEEARLAPRVTLAEAALAARASIAGPTTGPVRDQRAQAALEAGLPSDENPLGGLDRA